MLHVSISVIHIGELSWGYVHMRCEMCVLMKMSEGRVLRYLVFCVMAAKITGGC